MCSGGVVQLCVVLKCACRGTLQVSSPSTAGRPARPTEISRYTSRLPSLETAYIVANKFPCLSPPTMAISSALLTPRSGINRSNSDNHVLPIFQTLLVDSVGTNSTLVEVTTQCVFNPPLGMSSTPLRPNARFSATGGPTRKRSRYISP